MKFSSINRQLLFLFSAVLVVVFRIILVADRDILATYSPYDEYWHVDAALRWIWGGEYDHMSFAHLPIYAIWLKMLNGFGIPARNGIDMLWLIASGYLSFALFYLSRRMWVAVIAFILMAFHPYSLVLFDRALSETFLTVISAIVLAGFIEIWNLRKTDIVWRKVIAISVAGVGFAIAYHTRKEGLVLLIPIAMMAIISLWNRDTWWSATGRRKLGIPLVVMPLLATIVVGFLISSANYVHWGIFARHELNAPQYVRAIDSLLSIDSGSPTPRHVSVSAKTREMAYQASPTFAELRPYFEGSIGKHLERNTSEMVYGVSGEIGDWVFYWALRDAAASVGWHTNSKHAEKKYAAISDELDQAFSAGLLNKRPVWVSFVDPDWKKWAVFLFQSALAQTNLVIGPSISRGNLDLPSENASQEQFIDFSFLLGRKRVPQHAEMIGWVSAPAGSLVGIGNESGAFSWQILGESERPDVPGARPFSVIAIGDRPTDLFVKLPDKTIGSLSLKGLRKGNVLPVEGLNELVVGVDLFSIPNDSRLLPRMERLSSYLLHSSSTRAFPAFLAKLWGWIGYVLLTCTFMAVVIALFRKVELTALIIITLVISVVCGRVGIFSILDASSWYSQASRYMFPAVPFFIAAVVIGTSLLIKLIRGTVFKLDIKD